MSGEESKLVDASIDETNTKPNDQVSKSDALEGSSGSGGGQGKKSKRQKAKELLTGGKSTDQESKLKKAIEGLTPQQVKELVQLNPVLAQEISEASGSANPTADQTTEALKKMNLQDIMTGLAAGGKNAKDMGSYKFWQTQPVPRFGEDEKSEFQEGPLKVQTVDDVSKDPAPMVDGFEWVTMDLTSDDEVKEVYELLNGHYVEDDEAMFRFNYSASILRW